MEMKRAIHCSPRLATALMLIGRCDTLADIGCDHGRLSCAAIQSGAAQRCIAVDISLPSLEKARALATLVGVSDRVETRLGDGFLPISAGEADVAVLLGMGGTLMARLLDACPVPLMGAKKIVLQPMRAVEDIRRWLYERGYRVENDVVVRDAGRLYQVFSVTPPEPGRQTLPPGWPPDCFCFGYTAFAKRDMLLPELIDVRMRSHERRLLKGAAPALTRECAELQQILEHWEEPTCC